MSIMDIKKLKFSVIGTKLSGEKTVWCVIGPNKHVLQLDYHPAFKKLYPPRSLFPCVTDVSKANSRYFPDWVEIYSNIYEENCEYEFKAIRVEEDSRTFAKRMILEDDYGFQFVFKHPKKEDLSKVGSTIVCRVYAINETGLTLASTAEGSEVSEELKDLKESLFEKLHMSRAATFKEFNKRSFRGVWKSVIDKYPDTAHFIYELLQNADDAKATEVTILLDKKYLIFKHNGTIPFTVTDDEDDTVIPGHINSITGIGDSTKGDAGSTNKIGKFGIGFKSVFQYTNAPEIYDDNFQFVIRDYIVPERLHHDNENREGGETLFYIPFKDPQVAFKEIGAKLKVLANVTLFLHNLTHIRWRNMVSGEHKSFSKRIDETYTSSRNILLEKISLSDYHNERKLLMFSKNINIANEGKHRIYVGYFLTPDGSIDVNIRPKVHCFFPTSEKFDLCMITHAPFLLVDNRQQIKPHEKTNEILVQALGVLTAETLCELRDLGQREGNLLLNANIASIVQWDEYNPYANLYKHVDDTLICSAAIINPCVEKIKNAELLLSVDNKYYKARNCYHISPNSLAQLINIDQLKALRETDKEIGILCPQLNELDDIPISEEVELQDYSTTDFALDITEEFMAKQPLAWVNRFFGFLNNDARKSWLPDEKTPYFLSSPIIQTTKGNWVTPYIDGHINVFTEGDCNEYNVVSNNMMASRQVEKFLKDIGCKAPDQLDYINTRILEKYQDSVSDFMEDQLASDFNIIVKYYYSSSIESREKMMDNARKRLLLAGSNESGEGIVDHPLNLYLDTPDLKLFFKGKPDVYFFDSGVYKSAIHDPGKDKVYSFLRDLGIRTLPEVYEPEKQSRYNLTSFQREQLKLDTIRTTYEWVKDIHIRCLSNAVSKPDWHLSHAIWKLVSQIPIDTFSIGRFEYYYRTTYIKRFDSNAVETLRNNAWVFIDGKRKKPCNVSLEQFIQEGYEPNLELCELLGIHKRELDLVEAGASKAQIRQYELGKLAELYGLDEEDLRQKADEKKRRMAAQKEKEQKELSQESQLFTRDSLSAVSVEQFGSNASMPTSVISEEQKTERRQERLLEQKDRVLNDLQRDEEFESLRESLKNEIKYSKEWFDTLLLLEYKSDIPKDYQGNSKVISISFGSVKKDPNSERILILRNPSQPIPLEIESIDKIEVRFEFVDQEEKLITFEVASVRDFTLRLKAKASDKSFLDKTDWSKCTRAAVNANNPTELMGKLISAFNELNVEDGFNFKDNLQNNISFVFGPPGTGKTTYVSQMICDIMKKEPYCKILVLAPTNKACDVITEKIARIADCPNWLGRFITTGSDYIEQNGLLINRDTEMYNDNQCCIVSTIARLPYDGFVIEGGAPRLRELDWNYIIVDEASMIPIAQIVYAIYCFSPYAKIVVSGDPLQIPPIASEEAWKEENIYSMVNLSRFDNPKTEPIQFDITNLTTQYRSVPAIGEVFSRYSYAGLLKHNRSQEDQRSILIPGLPMKSISFVQFKVEKFDNIFGAKKLAGSNVQIYSVLLVTEICRYIAKKYSGGESLSIGIICPYVAESQMIERLIEQQENVPDNIKFNVGTIHGFQGDECDIVFVVFNPPKAMTTQPDRIMLNKKHIINVAISRARDYLFLLIPHPATDGFNNLYEIRRLGSIASNASLRHIQHYSSDDIEQIIFGRKFYLENNTFVTSHQMANVYSEPGMKYEVRIDDNSVDIQISE